MAWARATAIVATVARVVQLTGLQDLANLETDSELTLTDLILTANQAVYDQLEANGVDPTTLTNEEVFHRSVAWHFCALLAQLGYIGIPESLEPPSDPYAWSDPHFSRVRPKVSGSDSPRVPSEGIPAVGNFSPGWYFGGGTNNTTDQYYDDLPGVK